MSAFTRTLRYAFALLLFARLLFPFFDSPLTHLFSDPQRHWDGGRMFLHPDMMGSTDPFLYQLWMYGLQQLADGRATIIQLGCGLLCAAMPYGWYRALRELLPRNAALVGALAIGLTPESVSIYGYFMTETLLMTLLGFCCAASLRAQRRRTTRAFAFACFLWLCAAFTRTVALPMALGSVGWLWLTQADRLDRAWIGLAMALAFALPAGLHAKTNLGFFAPFGNLYFNEIYSASGERDIFVDYGPLGRYQFGCPSFYNPTYAPFSDWRTDRTGVVAIRIDTSKGRADWISALAQVKALHAFPRWRVRWEDSQYLLFGQDWPNSDQASWIGQATFWSRWLYAPLIAVAAIGAWRRRYHGREWLLPACALGTLLLLVVQSEGVMEARFREPLDALVIASVALLASRALTPSQLPSAA